MRVVIGHHELANYGGTESYVLTVALELQRLGHEVVLTASRLGAIAEDARGRGLTVVGNPERLPAACDLVLAQDAATAFEMAARYPAARRLLVAHSDFHALQAPPQLDGVCDAVVTMSRRTGRFVDDLAHHPPVVRLEQPIDLGRFAPRGPQRPRPRSALLLGNYLRGPLAEALEAACREAGLEPVQAGAHAQSTAAPEQAIALADVVIGLGRCVVEAMASGRAAYVYGIGGGDGWVTPERYPALAADGFGGAAFDDVLDPSRITADLQAWSAEMGPANRLLAVSHHNVLDHVHGLLALAEGAAGAGAPPSQAAELARLVRLQWQTWGDYVGALDGQRVLREALVAQEASTATAHAAAVAEAALFRDAADERDQARAALASSRAEIASMRAEQEAFRGTRRFRLVRALAAPADAVRRRLGRPPV